MPASKYPDEYPISDKAFIEIEISSTATFIANKLITHKSYVDYVYNKELLEQILYLMGPRRKKVKIEEVQGNRGEFFCYKVSNKS